MPGIRVGGKIINNIRYANDTVLIADNEEDLQHLVNVLNEESNIMGLALNPKKTDTMVISKQKQIPTCHIYLDNATTHLRQVDKFKYLGTWITPDGKCTTEVKTRIAQAKSVFNQTETILKSSNISINT